MIKGESTKAAIQFINLENVSFFPIPSFKFNFAISFPFSYPWNQHVPGIYTKEEGKGEEDGGESRDCSLGFFSYNLTLRYDLNIARGESIKHKVCLIMEYSIKPYPEQNLLGVKHVFEIPSIFCLGYTPTSVCHPLFSSTPAYPDRVSESPQSLNSCFTGDTLFKKN